MYYSLVSLRDREAAAAVPVPSSTAGGRRSTKRSSIGGSNHGKRYMRATISSSASGAANTRADITINHTSAGKQMTISKKSKLSTGGQVDDVRASAASSTTSGGRGVVIISTAETDHGKSSGVKRKKVPKK